MSEEEARILARRIEGELDPPYCCLIREYERTVFLVIINNTRTGEQQRVNYPSDWERLKPLYLRPPR
jgi:hypothetical protein